MKTVFLFLFSCLFVSCADTLPQCPSDTQARWHNCQGTETYADGEKYVGEYKNGTMHGKGASTFVNGDKYEGEYRDGKWHGQATLTTADGDSYEGEWRDGEFVPK